jgi:transposase
MLPAKVVIPPRANRREPIRWSKAIYKHRNLVERFFCRIKHFRRIASRYEKLAKRITSFIYLVGAIVCSA